MKAVNTRKQTHTVSFLSPCIFCYLSSLVNSPYCLLSICDTVMYVYALTEEIKKTVKAAKSRSILHQVTELFEGFTSLSPAEVGSTNTLLLYLSTFV